MLNRGKTEYIFKNLNAIPVHWAERGYNRTPCATLTFIGNIELDKSIENKALTKEADINQKKVPSKNKRRKGFHL